MTGTVGRFSLTSQNKELSGGNQLTTNAEDEIPGGSATISSSLESDSDSESDIKNRDVMMAGVSGQR